MHHLIILNEYLPIKNPLAKFVDKLVRNQAFAEDTFTILCKGRTTAEFRQHDNVLVITRAFGKRGGLASTLSNAHYRLFRKIHDLFLPGSICDTRLFGKEIKKVAKQQPFDTIVSLSGWFWCARLGSKLSRRFRVPFFPIYMDPFLENRSYCRYPKSRLEQIEKEWLSVSQRIFVFDTQYSAFIRSHKELSAIVVPLSLPFGYEEDELKQIKATKTERHRIVHAGQFYGSIRSPKPLLDFARLNPDYSFVSLGPLQKKEEKLFSSRIPPNVEFQNFKVGDDYLREIGKAEYLLLVDNVDGKEIPSKCYEYISSGKPIVLLFYSKNSAILNYLKGRARFMAFDIDAGLGKMGGKSDFSSIDEMLKIPTSNEVFKSFRQQLMLVSKDKKMYK